MNLIVETDIGHDPDDFFALCYLVAAGARIRAILVAAGDGDQVAMARFFCDQVGLDIPIGAKRYLSTTPQGMHKTLLERYGAPKDIRAEADGVDFPKKSRHRVKGYNAFSYSAGLR